MAELTIDEISSRASMKCGGIQLNLREWTLNFTCIFCELEMRSLKQFISHIQEHIVMTENENEILLKNVEGDLSVDEFAHADELMNEVQLRPEGDYTRPFNYEIEMLDDPTDGNVESSNNNDSDAQYIYQVSTEGEVETLQSSADAPSEEKLSTGIEIVSNEAIGNYEKKSTGFTCEVCGIIFSEEVTLELHRQRHKGPQQHRCQFCRINFPSLKQLKQHIRTHTGQRPYVCEDCGESFKSSTNYNTHRRRHTNEQLYVCSTCGKSFYDEVALREHIKTHTSSRPFICVECNMTFSQQKALMIHARMHTDIRKFSCTICRMTFAQNSGLLSHTREKHGNHLNAS